MLYMTTSSFKLGATFSCHTDMIQSSFFYFARCSDGSLYAGSCVDVGAREKMHNDGKGAKYTRSRLPVKIIYTEEFADRSDALRREALVKTWTKAQKEQLVEQREK